MPAPAESTPPSDTPPTTTSAPDTPPTARPPLRLPLRTQRLRLRAYRPTDAEALLPIYSQPGVARFLLEEPWTPPVAAARITDRLARTDLSGASRALALVVERSSDATVLKDVTLEVLDRFVRAPIGSGTHGFPFGDRKRDASHAPVIRGRLASITCV